MQLERHQTARGFGEVNVHREGKQIRIVATILMKPQGKYALGWQTGLALDASYSMTARYGRAVHGTLPPVDRDYYQKKGWLDSKMRDGKQVTSYTKEGLRRGLEEGHLRYTDNIVEPVAQKLIAYLAGEIDADGGTTVIYWACGQDGSEYELLGDVMEEQCNTLPIKGPSKAAFGNGTRLLPAVQYFVNRFHDAQYGKYIFITDGKLDDLQSVKRYTIGLAREVAAGKRNRVKCILVGVGAKNIEQQMEELDDLDTGCGVDIWDHKIVEKIEDLDPIEICHSEPIDPAMRVADRGVIHDSLGNVIKEFAPLTAEIEFRLPGTNRWFELAVGNKRIRQSLPG